MSQIACTSYAFAPQKMLTIKVFAVHGPPSPTTFAVTALRPLSATSFFRSAFPLTVWLSAAADAASTARAMVVASRTATARGMVTPPVGEATLTHVLAQRGKWEEAPAWPTP